MITYYELSKFSKKIDASHKFISKRSSPLYKIESEYIDYLKTRYFKDIKDKSITELNSDMVWYGRWVGDAVYPWIKLYDEHLIEFYNRDKGFCQQKLYSFLIPQKWRETVWKEHIESFIEKKNLLTTKYIIRIAQAYISQH